MTLLDTTPITERADVLPAQRRWPASIAFLTAWWLPATTARRTQHVSLAAAFLTHAVAIASSITVWCLNPPLSPGDTWDLLRGWLDAWSSQPLATGAATILALVLAEAAFVLAALSLAAWGAADEPLRASFTNALRHGWLQTAGLLPAVLVIGRFAWWHRSVNWAEGRYQVLWHGDTEAMTALACLTAAVWLLVMMLRAIGARRSVPTMVRQPFCEMCGYDLTTRSPESLCPECGTAVAASLGPDNRPGATWEHRRELGRVYAWWVTAIEAARRPARLGRQIRVSSRGVDHRFFLAAHIAALFVLGYASLVSCCVAVERQNPFVHYPAVVYFVAPWAGAITAIVSLLGAIASATLVGLVVSLWCGRNLMAAAVQVVGYLGGLGVVFCTLLWGLLVGFLSLLRTDWFWNLRFYTRMPPQLLGLLGLFALTAMAILLCVALLYKGTVAARYANR